MLHSFVTALTAATGSATTASNLKERSSIAGVVSLEGMLVIFSALVILWLVIEIMHLALHRKASVHKEKAKAHTPIAQAAANPNDAAIAAAIAATLAATEDNGALVAAITAAITAARAEAGETGAFRVVSFKRSVSKRGYRR